MFVVNSNFHAAFGTEQPPVMTYETEAEAMAYAQGLLETYFDRPDTGDKAKLYGWVRILETTADGTPVRVVFEAL